METVREITEYERERGKPIPSFLHGVTQTRSTVLLYNEVPELIVSNERSRELGGPRFTPDICVHAARPIDYTSARPARHPRGSPDARRPPYLHSPPFGGRVRQPRAEADREV